MPNKFEVLTHLVSWMKQQPLKYPWQKKSSPYHIWVSEIMLQQTVVTAVVTFYNKWMEKFPTIESLANSPLEEVLLTFEGLGYYSRARNMHKCAQLVVKDYQGEFPSSYDELVSLPGIGDYTARAILSFSFGESVLLVDANVKRVLRRLFLQEEWSFDFEKEYLSSLDYIDALSKRFINEGIMRLGQEVCLKGKPLCLICPLREGCLAFKESRQDIIKPRKREITLLFSQVYIVFYKNFFYLQKVEENRFKDFFLFPKITTKEKEPFILKNISFKACFPLKDYIHSYTRYKETLSVYAFEVTFQNEVNSFLDKEKGDWFSEGQVDSLPMPSLYRKIWNSFKKKLNSIDIKKK